jgi:septum formation protein
VTIILGSGSPRRKSILEGIFGAVEVISPEIDESLINDEPVAEYTERISHMKMDAVISRLNNCTDCCVITSDTIVEIGGRILGKPESYEEAESMLRQLSGKEHFVITGLCLASVISSKVERFYGFEKTSVRFRPLTDEAICAYLGMINYRDKAGSYAVQEHGDILVEAVNGSMTNVIGFPLRLFYKMLISSGAWEILFRKVINFSSRVSDSV